MTGSTKGRPRSLRYQAKNGTRRVVHRTGTAARVIGRLGEGDRVTGLTAGQFSLIDAMEHMVDELGPSQVRISAWGTGIYDIERTRAIRAEGRITDIRLLLDRGTFEKSPKFAGPLIEKLGVDAFRCLSVHAKVVIVHGERGCAVLRSSMNLNKNLRTEQFDIDVDAEVADFYRGWFDALWDESGRSKDNRAIIQAVYDSYLEEPDRVDERHERMERESRGLAGEESLSLEDLTRLFD